MDATLFQNGFRYNPDFGTVMLQGKAEEYFRQWTVLLRDVFRPLCTVVVTAPIFIDPTVLDTAEYSKNFSHLLYTAHQYNADHVYAAINPAACLHVFQDMRGGTLSDDGIATVIDAPCGRFERGAWESPFRLSSFHMTELVVIGTAEQVTKKRTLAEQRITSAFQALALGGTWQIATDSFFLGEDEEARAQQLQKPVKKEYVVCVDGKDVALASMNHHGQYFCERFRIRDKENQCASSFCFAFGMERLVAYSLLRNISFD